MRVGVVGLGRIGQFHARIVQALPGVDALVLTDVHPGRVAEIADELSAETACDVGELLERVDAVVIAAPTDTHVTLIRQAIDAGIPTFCEKPVALDLAATADIARRVRESGVLVQIGFQRRFDAGYGAARDAVRSGAMGRVYLIRIAAHDPAPPHESYIPGSGGIFCDLHIHDFDIVRWVLGQDVVEVYAVGAVLHDPMFAKYGDVDTTAATLTFQQGTLGVMTGTRHDPVGHDVRLELFGSGDSVVVGWDARTPLRSLEPGMPPAPDEPYRLFLDRFDAAYHRELATFLEVVRGAAPNPCTVEDAEVALRVALACERSRRAGRPVRVDEIVA